MSVENINYEVCKEMHIKLYLDNLIGRDHVEEQGIKHRISKPTDYVNYQPFEE
jgi:hypothetical protein